VTETLPPCPECSSEYAYEMGDLLVCPECGHEWNPAATAEAGDDGVIKDSVGNPLADGDSVTVVKGLKVKGSTVGIKAGTKVRNIRLIHDSKDDHDIDCKVEGIGPMRLKSSVVRKA
jgi:protein PhnA